MPADLPLAAAALEAFDEGRLLRLVDPRTFAKGHAYSVQNRVSALEVISPSELTARVRGSGATYTTYVDLEPLDDVAGIVTECTCPVGELCKHAVTLILAARLQLRRMATGGEPLRVAAGPRPEAGFRPQAVWERVLGPLVTSSPGQPVAGGGRVGLLLEVHTAHPSHYAPNPRPVLRARPVVPGKTGWIRTGIAWGTLGYRTYGAPPLDPAHRATLERMVAASLPTRYANAPDWLDLSALGPAWLESLRACRAAGIDLLTHQKSSGQVVLASEPAVVSLDLARTPERAVRVTPLLRLPDAFDDVDPTARWVPLGMPSIGVWALHGGNLYLAAFAAALDVDTQRLFDHGPVDVPPIDVDRFLATAAPALTRRFDVGSADASVEVVTASPPGLLLRVGHEPGTQLRLEWAFTYTAGGSTFQPRIGSSELLGLRDLAAERALLAGVVPLLPERIVTGAAPSPASTLTGFDVVAFVEDVLPRLVAAGVEVEVGGEEVIYTQAVEGPAISFSLNDSGDPDWFDLAVDVSVGDEQVAVGDLVRGLTLGEPALILPSGTWFRLDRPELDDLRRILDEARALEDRPDGSIRLSPFHTDLWDELVALGVVAEQSARWKQLVEGLAAPSAVAPPVPETMSATLRPYQVEGFAWLDFLRRAGLGGILADDMGLGKTLQLLTEILAERAEPADPDAPDGARPPWLVVAPTSVLAAWRDEAARFATGLRVCVLGETTTRRGVGVREAAEAVDVVVTSYAVFRLDAEEFRELDWAGMVLDEAQAVKNHRSVGYQCARRIRANVRFVVTGTPMENNLMELWALLSIAAPGMFPDPKAFEEHYRRPIEAGTAPERLDVLRRRMRPIMLRRTKQAVATDLPPKQEQVVRVDLAPAHRRLYDRGLARERQRVLGLLEDPARNRIAIFRALTLLRQLSLHPGLVDAEQKAVACAKLDTLAEMLDPVLAEGHQAIVFSQFTSFLALLRERLDAQGVAYSYLDGRTRKREEAVAAFRRGDTRLFVVSLKAGGTGLTLTEADYVFLLDPWWNPAVEAQAVDRAHRIGQDKHVNVYRLVATDTIEEKVLALQERKRELFATVVDEGALAGGGLTDDDVRALL